jgi:hypothetical protein
MNKLILTIAIVSALTSCGQKASLSDKEKGICTAISFDVDIAESLRQQTKQPIEQIPAVSEYGEILETKDAGLCSLVGEDGAYEFVMKEKENFRAKGYLLFQFEGDDYKNYIGVIKGQDELEIIKWRQTNGINYDLENKDIIEKLQTWKQQNDFVIVGASMDWLEFRFKTMPGDINTFAQDVYEFCPDIVEQGTGDMPTLIKEINRMHGVYLWWD